MVINIIILNLVSSKLRRGRMIEKINIENSCVFQVLLAGGPKNPDQTKFNLKKLNFHTLLKNKFFW